MRRAGIARWPGSVSFVVGESITSASRGVSLTPERYRTTSSYTSDSRNSAA